MSDSLQEEFAPGSRHRCTLRRSRRGKPRVGERASCECGAEYLLIRRRNHG